MDAMRPRKYRCPTCAHVQLVEPNTQKAVSVVCTRCAARFRIPKLVGPVRRKTSLASASVRKQIVAQADALRSGQQKVKLEQIVRERRFGDYDILDELGRGGMGVVYKAFHRSLKRMVALKIVLPDVDDPETMLKRFKREAELHARLSHPNIVHVYDSGVHDGVHYFAMDFVTGTQLTKLLGSPEFTLKRRIDICQQIAEALEHAHGHGVVHRDIKPDNVIVDAGWQANLVDFGIAKPTDTKGVENITRQGLAVGTPHYMAPEQFRPKLGKVGPLSDVYSLGAVMYHCLAGRPPFEADTPHQVLIKAATQKPRDLTGTNAPSEEPISADVAAVCTKAMKMTPGDRYNSAQAYADDLQRLLDGQEVQANPLSEGERFRRVLAKNRLTINTLVMAALVMLVVIGAFTVTAIIQGSQTDDVVEQVTDAVKDIKVAREDTVDEDVEDRLTEALATLRSAEDVASTGGRSVLFTALGASGLTGLLVLFFSFFFVIRPLRAQQERIPEDVLPDEIEATADEV